jgi:transposase
MNTFLLPSELTIATVTQEATRLVVQILSTSATACCPLCQSVASRVHSRYQRTLADLPCSGQSVIIRWVVRKFFCPNLRCARRIFTEQVPAFAAPSARMTQRLIRLLQSLAYTAGVVPGSRLAVALGMHASPTTLIRRLLRQPLPPSPPVRILGVDDWSWKKGVRYGTILVDHERQCIVDLLAERSAESFAAWLREHPTVIAITRDRSTEYAKAATKAAPQAQQIADRFHLVRNLVEMLRLVLARCRTEIRQAEQEEILPPEEEEPIPLPVPGRWRPRNPKQAEWAAQAHDAQRADRFHQIQVLRSHGLTWQDIAQRVGINEKTIRAWVAHGSPPVHASRGRRYWGKFDPYARYVLDRWQAGEHMGPRLYQEIVAQGYRGTLRTVQRFLQTLRRERKPVVLGPPSPVDAFTAKDGAWLFIKPREALTPDERILLNAVCQASPTAQQIYDLAQPFLRMLRQRESADLPTWLQQMESSPILECQRFADGIRRDYAAVVAGVESPYSNGRTEGFVNRLKTIKRSMYGRAGFPLLKHRVLLAA